MSTRTTTTTLPTGTWTIDPAAGELAFDARGGFGLAKVHGTFSDYAGSLTVAGDSAKGTLEIRAASLDTGLAMRDKHLRSPDFFDVDNHPVLTFALEHVASGDTGFTLSGRLRIRDNELPVTAPLTVSTAADGALELATELSVDRAAAGVGWARFGMITGPAALTARVVLRSAGQPSRS